MTLHDKKISMRQYGNDAFLCNNFQLTIRICSRTSKFLFENYAINFIVISYISLHNSLKKKKKTWKK